MRQIAQLVFGEKPRTFLHQFLETFFEIVNAVTGFG